VSNRLLVRGNAKLKTPGDILVVNGDMTADATFRIDGSVRRRGSISTSRRA